MPDPRLLENTLASAASTCALFAAANWGAAAIMGSQTNFFSQFLEHFVVIFLMPMYPLMFSMWNALHVWRVKRILYNLHYENGCIAIMTLCPMYILVPGELASEDQHLGPNYLQEQKRRITDSQRMDACPLELRPAARPQAEVGGTDDAAGAQADEDAAAESDEDAAAQDWICLQLPDTSLFGDRNGVAERLTFLSLGLVPTYRELSFLRSRNGFQVLVTGVQAVSYIVQILRRAVLGLGVSPFEAIVTFFCIIVILQLIIELYACGNYQRALLLRLDAQQFRRFRDKPRNDFQVHSEKIVRVVSMGSVCICLLISIPAMLYFVHYRHTYFLSALGTLLFWVAQMLIAIFLVLNTFLNIQNAIIDTILLVGTLLLFPCSVVMAVVSTTVNWTAFEAAGPASWFVWALPHSR